ncbi:sensor histidine kinase [Nocardioides jiangxiensis]|uniref:histidine kinase n=1 Tax=Nocardioides jiangxiensis TaxID=3064524 RepID=A0ABT9B4I6_9ACTN|nr:ATP-binding protein [Nocardioides sp. WY-20]MDO7869648.1 ATP-binding protein [Nocardioides sp. WY-20]
MDLIDSLPDGVVVLDAAGTVEAINAEAARMLGVDQASSVGQAAGVVLCLQDTEGRDWLEHNRPWQGLSSRTGIPEQSWLLPNGSEVLVVARIVRGSAGVQRVAVSLRSGRGRARLDRERSDLVATVAHELRSPLTGVKGFVQALLNRWDHLNDEQKKLMLSTVHSDSDRLSRLIAELLDVARIDTGRLQLYPRPSDAGMLAARVVDSVSQSTARTVVLDIERGLPPVQADPDKFVQVVTNLVENAVRHGEGTVLVTVGAGRIAEAPAVVVGVQDEGAGIAEEIRRRVFTKFWKHGTSGGSGLGMYLVNGLVRAHGGQVEIGSAPGGGALVSVLWPASTA